MQKYADLLDGLRLESFRRLWRRVGNWGSSKDKWTKRTAGSSHMRNLDSKVEVPQVPVNTVCVKILIADFESPEIPAMENWKRVLGIQSEESIRTWRKTLTKSNARMGNHVRQPTTCSTLLLLLFCMWVHMKGRFQIRKEIATAQPKSKFSTLFAMVPAGN